MKIGVFASLFAPHCTPEQIATVAKQLDQAGLDSLWFGEHVMLFDEMEFPYPGSPDGKLPVPSGQGAPDQGTLIAYCAAHTQQLRFGTGISLIPQRNPIYTAKEFATLDWLTQGRINLGVGVGWCKEEVEGCGYSFNNRGERCDEALDLITQLWQNDITDHNGKHFSLSGARMDPKPIQAPHIPLFIGGFSQAALERTAKYGQGWLGFGITPGMTEALLAKLQLELEKQQRSLGDLNIAIMPAVDDDKSINAFMDLDVDLLLPMLPVGQVSETHQRLERIAEIQQLCK